MTDPATSAPAAPSVPAITLRVAEARVDDIAHAIARLSAGGSRAHRRTSRRHPEDHGPDDRRRAR